MSAQLMEHWATSRPSTEPQWTLSQPFQQYCISQFSSHATIPIQTKLLFPNEEQIHPILIEQA